MTEWKRVKIGEVCRIEKGATGIASATPGDYPLVVTALERKTCSTYQFDCEAVCIPLVSSSGHGKKSLKYVHYQSGKFALGTILAAVIPNDKNELSARYLHQYLQFYKDTLIVPLMHGAANVSLAIRDIEQIEIPLPPIEEQNEFAKLFVRMQENDVKLQSEFETQKDLIKKLRQSILQDAIEGKLTSQWRIENGKLKMGACASSASYDAGSVVSQNPRGNKETLPPISDEEKPFEIPETWKWAKKIDNGELRIDNFETPFKIPKTWKWAKKIDNGELRIDNFETPFKIPKTWKWVRLNQIASNIVDCPHSTPPYLTEKTNYYAIDTNCINSKSEITSFRYIDEQTFNLRIRRLHPQKGDIVYTREGSICRAVILPDGLNICLGQRVMLIRSPVNLNPNFLRFILISPKTIQSLTNKSFGAGAKHINVSDVSKLPIPLPPLAEQNEIVHRVENQLAKVEQLEQQVQERETLTKLLFRGILKSVFEDKKY